MPYSKTLAVITLLVVTGCSEGTDSKTPTKSQAKPQQGHIWQQQTQAIERAKAVESVMSYSAKRSLDEADSQAK